MTHSPSPTSPARRLAGRCSCRWRSSAPRAARSPASPARTRRPTAASHHRRRSSRWRRRRAPASTAADGATGQQPAARPRGGPWAPPRWPRPRPRRRSPTDGPGARRAVRARWRRHRRRHRHRDRHRHPRPGHRRVADPADELRHRQGHLLEVPRRAARPTSCSVARCGSCSVTTSSTRRPRCRSCREMVEDDGAFLLVGGGGADQITACAQYAADNGIPYLSAGVNENGLSDLDTYFATTLTYAEQAPMLIAQLQAAGHHRDRPRRLRHAVVRRRPGGDQGRGRRGRRSRSPTRPASTRRRRSPSSSRSCRS